jgi:hypothetical protein
MTQPNTLKEFATVNDMLMFYARQSVKSCFQIERENNIKVAYSEVKREYNYAIAEHKSNLSIANIYDQQLNNIPANSTFMGSKYYCIVGYVKA